MNKRLLLFVASIFCFVQVYADSFVNMRGQIKNQTAGTIDIILVNGWLDPIATKKTLSLDTAGNFSTAIQFEELLKPVLFIYGTDTIELVLTGGEGLIVSADAKNFMQTIFFDGTGGANANFCVKHTIQRGRLSDHLQSIEKLYKKDAAAFEKAITAEHKDELDFFTQNSYGATPRFSRYWRICLEYDKYCNMFQYQYLHKGKPAITKVLANIPAAYNDEYVFIPYYRNYIRSMTSMYSTGDNTVFETLLFAKMPPSTGEYAMATTVYTIAQTNPTAAKPMFDKFRGHFPNSTYIPLLAAKFNF